jgi:hypothetical protein
MIALENITDKDLDKAICIESSNGKISNAYKDETVKGILEWNDDFAIVKDPVKDDKSYVAYLSNYILEIVGLFTKGDSLYWEKQNKNL